MVCVTHPFISTMNARTKVKQERVEVSKIACQAIAVKVVEKITACRNFEVAQLVALVREKRIARNRLLPPFFKYSLNEEDILTDHITQKAQIYLRDSKAMGAGSRLLALCSHTQASTVSVISRDWSTITQFKY